MPCKSLEYKILCWTRISKPFVPIHWNEKLPTGSNLSVKKRFFGFYHFFSCKKKLCWGIGKKCPRYIGNMHDLGSHCLYRQYRHSTHDLYGTSVLLYGFSGTKHENGHEHENGHKHENENYRENISRKIENTKYGTTLWSHSILTLALPLPGRKELNLPLLSGIAVVHNERKWLVLRALRNWFERKSKRREKMRKKI